MTKCDIRKQFLFGPWDWLEEYWLKNQLYSGTSYPILTKLLVGNVGWAPDRLFAIDMEGFAVNIDSFLGHSKAAFPSNVQPGFRQPEFLKHFDVKMKEFEPKVDGCTKVYVWHTRHEQPNLSLKKENCYHIIMINDEMNNNRLITMK